MDSSEKKYCSIGTIAKRALVEPHILRYWEQCGLIKPVRLSSGQRRYTTHDLERIRYIKALVYEKKYQTAGVKRELNTAQKNKQMELTLMTTADPTSIKLIRELRSDIKDIVRLLK